VEPASSWAELERAQVLRGNAFAHDLVGEAVLRTIPLAVARRLHAQCAEWLQDHGAEPARVAEHRLASGVPARAGAAFEEAFRRAELAMRMTAGCALLLRAAAAFDAADLPGERYRVLMARMMGLKTLDIGANGLQDARDLITAAANERERLLAQAHFVGMLTERGEAGVAAQDGRPVIAQARAAGEWEVALPTARHLATALVRLGQVDEALAVLLPLRSWAETQPDPSLKMLWFGDWAVALGAKGGIREGLNAYEVAMAAAREAVLPDAVTLRPSGRLDRAVALARQGRHRQETEVQDAAHVPIDRLLVARDDSETGHYESALAAIEDILPRFEANGAHVWAQATRMVLVRLWLDLGQPARAVPQLRDEPDALPAWLRVDRQLMQVELGLAQRQLPETSAAATTLALALGQVQRAAEEAGAALDLLVSGHAPDGMRRAEAHLAAARALHAADRRADAVPRQLPAAQRGKRGAAGPGQPLAARLPDGLTRRHGGWTGVGCRSIFHVARPQPRVMRATLASRPPR